MPTDDLAEEAPATAAPQGAAPADAPAQAFFPRKETIIFDSSERNSEEDSLVGKAPDTLATMPAQVEAEALAAHVPAEPYPHKDRVGLGEWPLVGNLQWRAPGWWIDGGGRLSDACVGQAWPSARAMQSLAAFVPALGGTNLLLQDFWWEKITCFLRVRQTRWFR